MEKKILAVIYDRPSGYYPCIIEVSITRSTSKYHMLEDKRDILGSIYITGMRVRIGDYKEFDTSLDAARWLVSEYNRIIAREQSKLDKTRADRDHLFAAVLKAEDSHGSH